MVAGKEPRQSAHRDDARLPRRHQRRWQQGLPALHDLIKESSSEERRHNIQRNVFQRNRPHLTIPNNPFHGIYSRVPCPTEKNLCPFVKRHLIHYNTYQGNAVTWNSIWLETGTFLWRAVCAQKYWLVGTICPCGLPLFQAQRCFQSPRFLRTKNPPTDFIMSPGQFDMPLSTISFISSQNSIFLPPPLRWMSMCTTVLH